MKNIVQLILTTAAALSLQPAHSAAPKGIRIVSTGSPVSVYLDGEQVSPPAQSCFIANLKPGEYRIEAYMQDMGQDGEREVYAGRVSYSGDEIRDVIVDTQEAVYPEYPFPERIPVMGRRQFESFLQSFKDGPFEKDRQKLLDIIARNSYFTTEQVGRIAEFYSFDKDKLKIFRKLYPRTVDPEYFYTLAAKLTFRAGREELEKMILGN